MIKIEANVNLGANFIKNKTPIAQIHSVIQFFSSILISLKIWLQIFKYIKTFYSYLSIALLPGNMPKKNPHLPNIILKNLFTEVHLCKKIKHCGVKIPAGLKASCLNSAHLL